ncbi:hypothetical protein [Microbispora sp. KK1-11]|nr:hypothetical protein [Microbispora sp. KK1-11]
MLASLVEVAAAEARNPGHAYGRQALLVLVTPQRAVVDPDS